jgi:PHD/YefM family antitoxin component YafN of YafNO toxin-antitoxin module
MIQTESITNFRTNYRDVLKRALIAPVLLLQKSTLAGVLVSPEEWNRINDELMRLRRIVQADKDFAEMRNGKYTEG